MYRWIYGNYCRLAFFTSALFILPVLYLSVRWGKTYATAGRIYQGWARAVFTLCGIHLKKQGFEQLNTISDPVILCPNHSSYFDIPLLYHVLPATVAFMGKSELGRLPVFGYCFRQVHISVNRKSPKGKAKSLEKAREMLKKGRSVVIFPEGTIEASIQPGLLPFKDGAFKLAIEEQVPIIPVVMPYNWIFMPDDGRFLPRRAALEIKLLEPILPEKEADPNHLKLKVRALLEEELRRKNGCS